MNDTFLLILTVLTGINTGIYLFSPSAKRFRKTHRDMKRVMEATSNIDDELLKEVASLVTIFQNQNDAFVRQNTALEIILSLMNKHAQHLDLSPDEREQLVRVAELYATESPDLERVLSVYKRFQEQMTTKH